MSRIVWLDTNFLMVPVQFKVDIFTELERLLVGEPFEVCVPGGVIRELKRLATGKGRDAMAAKVGLRLVALKGVKVVASQGHVDDWLVEKAGEGGFVCTNDVRLIRRLRDVKVRRIQLRGRNHLDFAY